MEVPGRQTVKDDNISNGLVCHPCQEESATQPAHGYCINCKEYLCEMCYKYHRRPKPFKDHVLVDKDIDQYQPEKELEETPPPLPKRENIINIKCKIHQSEDLKHHCRAHKITVCSVCALKQHKDCENVHYIPDIYESENRRVMEKIAYVEEKVEYILKLEREALLLVEDSYKMAISELLSQKMQINRYFEETEKRFNDSVLRFREESKKRENETLEIERRLKNKKEQVTVSTPGSEIKKFISILKTEEYMENINANLQGVFCRASLNIAYKPQQVLQVLGEATVEPQGDVETRKLKLLRKVNVAAEEATCSIIDWTTSPDDKVMAVADAINIRLVVISENYEVTFCQLGSKPWGVTFISDTEVAVSLPEDKQVKFTNVRDDTLCSNRKSINVSGAPYGIRYRKSDYSLVIVNKKSQRFTIEYWSLDGHFLRTVTSHDYAIDHMTLTADEKILYSSSGQHLICLLEPDGTELKAFQYVDDNMLGPYGIGSDALGNIYVCGQKRLRVVSKEGKWEQIIAPEDGFAPQSLLYCDKTKVLFVGQARGYKEVLVFQI